MPAKRTAPTRHLSSMQELTELETLCNNASPKPVEMVNGERLVFLKFSRIRPFAGHPFRLYIGERLEDMVDSIRRNGIIMPLIVRRIYDDPDYDFEMLSGHNRMNAGTLAGLDGAYCLVKESLSYAEARAYVIETNLFQRSFKDLLPSEKAAALTDQYSELFSQGKRNDILLELEMLEQAVQDSTCGNGFHKLNRDSLGDTYELTGRSVANYIRIGRYLSEGLKLRLDHAEFTLRDSIQLSHLSQEHQHILDKLLTNKACRVNSRNVTALRRSSESGTFTAEHVLPLLCGSQPAFSQRQSFKLGYQIYSPYFASTASKKEIEETIRKALEYYFSTKKGDSASA